MINVIIKDDEDIILLSDGTTVEVSDILRNVSIDNTSIEYLKKLECQIIKGKKFNELYLYDNIEMYNFNRASLYEKLKEFMSRIILLDEIIKYMHTSHNYCSEKIYITTDDVIIADLAANLFQIENVKFESKIKKISDKEINNIKKYNKRYLLVKRMLKGIGYFIKSKFGNHGNKILILTQAGAINSIKINDELCHYDSLYGKIIEQLKNGNDVFNVQLLNSENVINKLYENCLPFELIKIYRKIFGKLLFNSNEVVNNLSNLRFFNFTYNNFDLYEYVNKYVLGDLEQIYINYVEEILVLKKLIKDLNIKKVLVVDEADRPRCAIVAGNMLNIDTFGLQHGLINTTSVAYMIPSSQKILVPKNTFLWGEEFKNVLIKNTKVYGEEMIKVVGQPRTDYLYEKNKEYKVESHKNKLNILFATQPIKDLSEDSFKILCKGICKFKNYNLIIKMHPGDNNYEFYNENLKKFQLKNVEITKEKDLYDCLLWCNVVISVHSTVVLEGAILGKPSICILLPKYNDEGNFVKDGLSLGVENHNELLHILSNIDILQEKSYEEFVNKNFYKIDGKVAKRIVNIINNKCEVEKYDTKAEQD